MKRFLIVFVLLSSILSTNAQNNCVVILENKTSNDIVDYTAEISVDQLKKLPLGNYIAEIDGSIVPVELSTNVKNESKIIFPVSSLKAKEKKRITIKAGTDYTYPKRTYAELAHKIGGAFEGQEYKGGFSWVKPNYLRVPDNFKDHAYYIKYEGPGWESDKIAFRMYLDQRNAIDVFAKKTPGIVLPFVGVDNYETYHHMADWGMDNMKVGKALGVGTIAIWDGEKAVRVEKTDSVICQIQADGKIRSQVMTKYFGWNANGTKCNMQSLISIDAGSRASHMEIFTDKKIDNIATGINLDKNAEVFTLKDQTGEWTCLASFGKQSLNDDMMGLAVFVKTNQIKQITTDKLNNIVILQPTNGYVDYYFMATWELDWEPIVSKADFQRCIDEVMNRLPEKNILKIIK